MASLTLDRDETGSDFLPPRCMRCGAATEEYKERAFVWSHPALICLVFLGLPGIVLLVILRAVMAKRMTVDVPICSRHRHHWAVRTGIVAFILIAITAMMVTFLVANREIEQQFGGNVFPVLLLILAASIPVMIVVSVRRIRPTKIDANEIQLAGVDAGFAEEVREKQRVERDAYRARRKAERDAEPIYDDDPA